MREQTLEEKRENLINDLIEFSLLKEKLWDYHPDNPKKVDVVTDYNNLESKIVVVESELDSL